MNNQIKLTNQENKIINYLSSKDQVYWEELAQFAKDPKTVKFRTLQKVISDLKKKYKEAGISFPFNRKLIFLSSTSSKDPIEKQQEQKLVQVRATPGKNIVRVDSEVMNKPTAHIDFQLNFNNKSVKTKSGEYRLNDREWDVMKYFYSNVGKVIKLSEFRDKVVYPQFGSKLPPRWFDHIKSIIGNLRAQVPGLKDRILTVKSVETSYLFQ